MYVIGKKTFPYISVYIFYILVLVYSYQVLETQLIINNFKKIITFFTFCKIEMDLLEILL